MTEPQTGGIKTYPLVKLRTAGHL